MNIAIVVWTIRGNLQKVSTVNPQKIVRLFFPSFIFLARLSFEVFLKLKRLGEKIIFQIKALNVRI